MDKMTRIGFCSFCLASINVPDSEIHHFWDYYYRVDGKNYHKQILMLVNKIPITLRCRHNQKLLGDKK